MHKHHVSYRLNRPHRTTPRTTSHTIGRTVAAHSVILSGLFFWIAQLFEPIVQPQTRRRRVRRSVHLLLTLLAITSTLASSINIIPLPGGTSGYVNTASAAAPSGSGALAQPAVTETAAATSPTSPTPTPASTSAATSTSTFTFTSTPTSSSTLGTLTTTPVSTSTFQSTSTPTIPATLTPPPTSTIGTPTPVPTMTRILETNYEQQAIDTARDALLTQVNALPVLTGTITGTLVSGLTGGKITSPDGSITLGMMPGVVPVTDTINVQINPRTFPQGDARATHNGQPLAYTYEFTATRGIGGPPVERFNKDVVLIWNVDPATLQAAGVHGFPLKVYTYNEGHSSWEEIESKWNPQTNQLIATTPHFSLYTTGDGFDKINNYLPSVNNFEVDLQSGSASVNYPINVPAGPGGLGPKVSLSYNSGNVDRVDNSQQGTSSVGWGWSLSTSYIAASQHFFGFCGQGAVDPWTASIVMDGANGDLVKGSDGYWHTANESFARIQYFPGTGRTDDKWIAWDKDGTRYEFDKRALDYDEYNRTGSGLCNQAHALTSYKWMLSKATDVHNNVVNYSYKYEDVNNVLQDIPITDNLTRAVYPREITYGADQGAGTDKVQVLFNVVPRAIGLYNDYSGGNVANEIYQSWRIDRIDVNRRQADTGQYALLRSYSLAQSYDISLNGTGGPYRHLTLTGITPKGNDGVTQLPSTTFTYFTNGCCAGVTYVEQDWGHLWSARNGYGGEVQFEYDAAGGNSSSSWYRRVHLKRVKDGLSNDPNSSHYVTYAYDYRGATTNNTNISDEANLASPLHIAAKEFRGYAWVREQDPSGQSVDHYYSQNDVFKAKEWRVQTGKGITFTETMNVSPTATPNPKWAVSGSVLSYSDPQLPGNGVWKLSQGSSIARTTGLGDGSDASMRLMVRNHGDPDRLHAFIGNWKMEKDPNNYWGLQIYSRRVLDQSEAGYHFELYGKVVWKANGIAGFHDLSPRSTSQIRPFVNELEPDEWYRVMLHTSPDGRFALEMYKDWGSTNPQYVMLKSADVADDGQPIPSFTPGGSWAFKQDVQQDDGLYWALADDYSESRTVYSQSDTVYQDQTGITAASPDMSQWRVGLANNAAGMNIRFVPVMESWNALYGDPCCQPNYTKRSKTTYSYNDPTYGTRYGNQVSVFEYGDLDTTADDRSTHYGYAIADRPNADPTLHQYIVGKVGFSNTYSGITPNNGGPNFMASTVNFYDNQPYYNVIPVGGKGLLTQVTTRGILSGNETGQSSTQQFTYDVYGQPFQAYDPNNNITTTWYDGYYHAFPTTKQYPNGRSDSTAWNYRVDMPSRVTDINGTNTDFLYDQFGRPWKNWTWTATQSFGSEQSPNDEFLFPDVGQQSLTPPFRISYQKRVGINDGQITWQTRWFDGRGRAIQDVSPKQIIGANTSSVIVNTEYNINGQVLSKYLPYEVPGVLQSVYTQPDTTKPKLTNYYDGIGRVQMTTNPDYNPITNPNSRTWYDHYWLLQSGVLDESNHWKSWQVTDMYGRVTTTRELDQTQQPEYNVYTTYLYNALNQLFQVTRDTGGSLQTTSTMQYDGLGRKSQMTDPDMGTWQYGYDPAGNLTVQKDALYLQNPNANSTHQVFFCYDNMNRIRSKFYGNQQGHYVDCGNGGNNGTPDVKYYYDNDLGDASTTNSWGKLRKAEVTLAGQGQEKANDHKYEYDPRGLPLKEEISAPFYSTRTYRVQYEYDKGGRQTSLTYPDPEQQHEQVTTTYNTQAIGLPSRLSTNKSAVYPVYDATYNARGQMMTLDQGSDGPSIDRLLTAYTYDDATTMRGWLTRSRVTSPDGNGGTMVHLDLNTTYNANGNIASIQNQGITAPSTSNPEFSIQYQYDAFDRLTRATSSQTGNYGLFPEEWYTFDRLDRINTRQFDSGPLLPYTYDPNHKDAPASYNGNTYGYDANGNQTSRAVNGSTQTRTFDPEGRVTSIQEGNVTTVMVYDANGQRLIKNVTVITPTATSTPTYTPTNTPTPTYTPTNTPTPTSTPACPVSTSLFYPHYTDLSGVNDGYQMNSTSPGGDLTINMGTTSTVKWYSATQSATHFTAGDYVFNVQVQTCGTYKSPDRVTYTLEYTDADGSNPVQIGSTTAAHYYSICGPTQNFTVTIASAHSEVHLYNKRLRLTATLVNGTPVIYLGASTYLSTPAYYLCIGGGYGSGNGNGGSEKSPTATTSPTRTASASASASTGASPSNINGKPSGLNTISSGRTLYIGGLYEEELTGSSNPPYTSYYSFAGKLVGMRKGNQQDPSTNGQLRMVGDHLGSTTLVVDTATNPHVNVVQRQYYKPYGEVARSYGTGQTSIGFTGQRLDGDSGLMYYGARFYDPVLSYFVSADGIAPGKGDPKTRNRYSYVLNNPLRYLDPSGHSEEASQKEQKCNSGVNECNQLYISLYRLGINVKISDWTLTELSWVYAAIQDMKRQFSWSDKDFMAAIGTNTATLFLERSPFLTDRTGTAISAFPEPGQTDTMRTIILYGNAFANELTAKAAFVHELAHAWDYAETKRRGGKFDWSGGGGVLSQGMRARTNGGNGYSASEYATREFGTAEDWAEAVTATVYESSIDRYKRRVPDEDHRIIGYDGPRMDSTRRSYVYEMAIGWSTQLCPVFGGCRR